MNKTFQKINFTTTPEGALKQYEISRHKNRPKIHDYIPLLFEDFIELHGDRRFGDDKAMLTGIGMFAGIPVTVIGVVKGRSTKENIACNFGLPHPEGYRKAMRQMRLAEKFGRPVLTFVDTAGAYCGVSAEERGQGGAIAESIMEMMGLRVPVISVLTGEGGSGGALGIACANRVFILENATYSVITAKGFASILWKDPSRENEAVQRQRMVAEDLLALGVVDKIIPEPAEGAHKDPALTAAAIKVTIEPELRKLMRLSGEELYADRYKKFRHFGFYIEN